MWSMTAKDAKTSRQGEAGLPIGEFRGETHHSYPCDITSSTAIGGFSGTVPERLMAQLAPIAVCRWEHRRHEGTTWVSPRLQHPFLSLSSVISVLFSSALPSL